VTFVAEGMRMILFSFAEYQNLALQIQRLPSVQLGQFRVSRFANQELYAVVETAVVGRHCLILGSIAPPDMQTLSLSLLAHTLKNQGAQRVTAVLPYLGYSRQDKPKVGESLGTAWMGAILEASGVDEVLTIDVHSNRDAELFTIRYIRSHRLTCSLWRLQASDYMTLFLSRPTPVRWPVANM
jgi:ribose-phosphate pyrophosphokinase